MKNEITHLDIFTGFGGFKIAAEREGFRTIGFAEVDKDASKVLGERWPGVRNLGDVRRRDAFAGLGHVTVLTGGFTCQPWSEAGQRRGQADDRHLWPAMRDIAALLRPTWIIGENVPGIINLGLEFVCSDLEKLGYSTQPLAIPAGAAGAWHRRNRVWILAHLDGPGCRAGEKICPRESDADGRDQGICADAAGRRREGRTIQETEWRPVAPDFCGGSWRWPIESPLVRVVHGIPRRAHRIKGLGNAIVPQIAQPFFHWIKAIEQGPG